jgi:hypothetical protein
MEAFAIDGLRGRTLNRVTEATTTCRICGATFEIPTECAGGVVQTISHKDPDTRRPTGLVVIMVNSTRVHECWRELSDPRE